MSDIFLGNKLTHGNQFDFLIRNNKESRKQLMGLKNRSGVYILYHKNRCLYVGVSRNLYIRASRFFYKPSHFGSFNVYNNFYLRAIMMMLNKFPERKAMIKLAIILMDGCTIKELSDAEQKFIEQFNPMTNCGYSKYERSKHGN